MEPMHDARLRMQADKVYSAIGMQLPGERKEEDAMRERSHGGAALLTNFHPTESGPKLNVVHGPLAQSDPLLSMQKPVVGLPVVGAGLKARLMSDNPETMYPDADIPEMDTIDDSIYGISNLKRSEQTREVEEEQPYFYPRRTKRYGGVRKQNVARKARKLSRHPKNNRCVQFI